jgi:hypothetical protein
VVLVSYLIKLPPPHRNPPDLFQRSVTFDDEEIAFAEGNILVLISCDSDFRDLVQF